MHNFVALNHCCSMMTETRHEIASIVAADKSIIHTFVKLEFSLVVAIARVRTPCCDPHWQKWLLGWGIFHYHHLFIFLIARTTALLLLSQIWVLLLLLVLFHSFTPCPCWCHFLSKALLLLLEVNDRVCRILTAAFKKGWVYGVPLMQFHFWEKSLKKLIGNKVRMVLVVIDFLVELLFQLYPY